jgi:uncharacterized protein (DUF4213/DUF364 family)
MWKLYDELIEEIPSDITVDNITVGLSWTAVAAGKYLGAAMTVREQGLDLEGLGSRRGQPLKYLASLSKSWNFTEASIGVAAINAYFNNKDTWKNTAAAGQMPWKIVSSENAFDAYGQTVTGKRVAVIGHFHQLEKYLTGAKEVCVLERRPTGGDYPDSACEYLLPQQDYVFITGATLVNKTLPRLLELSKNAKVVLVGPSSPMTPILFSHGVEEISGFMVGSSQALMDSVSIAGHKAFFQCGERVRMLRKSDPAEMGSAEVKQQ